jgi:small-conductance mechanosensitive channel
VAGTILTYMRPFRQGDRVTIGETQGVIVEKSLLVTRVRTPKNVVVTIPNGSVIDLPPENWTSENESSPRV